MSHGPSNAASIFEEVNVFIQHIFMNIVACRQNEIIDVIFYEADAVIARGTAACYNPMVAIGISILQSSIPTSGRRCN